MPTRQREAGFIEHFKAEVYQQNRHAFVYKIPDAYRTGLKPFDVILDVGFVRYLEFKWLEKTRKTFQPKDLFRPHQIRILNQIQEQKKYPACFGVVQARFVYLLPAHELLSEQICLDHLAGYTLAEAVRILCQEP